ncbi:tyrosine-type recombinase/integrase [Sporosarcina sp. FA9]|uniref:tyrosine-type recombinase/integrase n=1 Tax=Sporosarcina sp. FA9 TaxID=3413030 RepID=UPI003F660A54
MKEPRKRNDMKGIRKRSEKTYQFTVSTGKASTNDYGRKFKTYVVTKKMTPKQLEDHLKHEYLKFKEEVLSGEYITPEKMTFTAFAEEWKEKFAENELSETTYIAHLSRLDNHIIPVIGHLSMDGIRPMMLDSLLLNLTRKDGTDKPLSNSSKEDIFKTLKSIFKFAKNRRIIKTDPMDGLSKPKNKNEAKRVVNVYEPEEVTALFKAIGDEPYHWRVFVVLALTGGLRRGELLGLEWSSVDFENSRIDINQTIVKGRNGPLIKSPKTETSERLVSLPVSVMDELKRYRVHWLEEKLKMGDKRTEREREWLFCNEDGTHFSPDTPGRWWRRFAERSKFRYIRLHDWRHTSATLLIAQGVHAKIISERLGHSNIKITMDTYGHALRSADQAAADTFESLFKTGEAIK